MSLPRNNNPRSRDPGNNDRLVFAASMLGGFLLTLIVLVLGAGHLEPSAMPDRPEGVGEPSPAKDNPSGVQGSRLPDAGSQGASATRVALIAALYDEGLRQVNADLARAIERQGADPTRRGPAFAAARALELDKRIRARLDRLGVEARALVEGAAQAAARAGVTHAREQLDALGLSRAVRRVGAGSVAEITFAGINDRAVAAIADDTLARLRAAAEDHAGRAVTLFRTLSASEISGPAGEAGVNRAIARGILTGNPEAADRAVRDLFRAPGREGLAESYRKVGNRLVQVGGWTGTVRAYTATVVRTRTREATVEARHAALGEAGVDLVQIVGANTVNFCTRMLGLVVSLRGATPGFPLLASLPGGGPPFHPDCSKGTAPYVEGLVSDYRLRVALKARESYERDVRAGTLTTDLRPDRSAA